MSEPKLRFKGFDGDWLKSSLKELSIKITDGTHDTPVVQKEGVPFLTAINIKDGFINYKDIGFVDENTHNKIFERCNPEKDDLLIVNIGAGTATCARNIVDYPFSLKNVALVKPNKKILNPIFFEQVQRKSASKLFTSLTSGGAQPFLSLKEIGKLLIIYPPVEEQSKIASFLSAVDEKISQLTQKYELLSQYKQGMMQKLFSQQIRFKADDESEFGEWEGKTLLEVADIVGGGTPSTSQEEYWNGDVVWLTPSEVDRKFIGESKRTISKLGVQKSSAKILPIGTILFTSRATIGEVAISTKELSTNQGFQSFIVKPIIINEYLYYWVKHNKKQFIERASGSTFLEISKSKMQPMEILLPCLAEQSKIANFLTTVDQKMEVVAQQIEQAKQWKKGLLQQMFV